MPEKVAKTGVRRDPGLIYFIDGDGDVAAVRSGREGQDAGPPEKVVRLGITKEAGYLYYLDQAGDVVRAKMEGR